MAASRPRVVLSAAASIDGRIAAAPRDSRLSSGEDLRRVHRLRSACDAIVVGRRTVDADDPMLVPRPGGGPPPLRVVVSSRAAVPLGSRLVRTALQAPTLVACSRAAPRRAVERLRGRSVEVFAAGAGGEVDLRALLAHLRGRRPRPVRTVMLEGGGETNWRFLREGLVDEIRLTVAPVVIGGGSGGGRSVPLVGGSGFASTAAAARFRLASSRRLRSGEIALTYAAESPPPAPRARAGRGARRRAAHQGRARPGIPRRALP